MSHVLIRGTVEAPQITFRASKSGNWALMDSKNRPCDVPESGGCCGVFYGLVEFGRTGCTARQAPRALWELSDGVLLFWLTTYMRSGEQ